MSIITDNKVIRAAKWPYANRGKLLVLAFLGGTGAMGYDNIKPLEVCDAVDLDFKNASRIVVNSPESNAYKDERLKASKNAKLQYNCQF